jgi:hypothetical protein
VDVRLLADGETVAACGSAMDYDGVDADRAG